MTAYPRVGTRVACLTGIAMIALVLGGCVNMSGVGGSSEYGCKAPEGVHCTSVSGVYHNAMQSNLPSQRSNRPAPTVVPSKASGAASARTVAIGASSGTPGYTPTDLWARPEILRLWYKAWQDSDRDLHDQGYLFVQTGNGHWLIDHVQQRTRDAYAPIRSTRSAAADQPRPDSSTESPNGARSLPGGPLNGVLPPRIADALRERAQGNQ